MNIFISGTTDYQKVIIGSISIKTEDNRKLHISLEELYSTNDICNKNFSTKDINMWFDEKMQTENYKNLLVVD